MTGTRVVLYDPRGLIEAELPLDRAPHEALVTAVLAWKNPDLAPRDYEQIALQLTGHARAVAADVRRHAAALPKNDGRGALAEVVLAEVVLREADGRLAAPLEGTVRCVQNRASLVRSLYTRLDRLTEPAPAAP
ncbi:restriction endonuclease [Streptomyces sp. NPDC057740]|uniref:restriction endonuclease n=1 Tax=Streptomyces sp. NPDC057740 TaxID=3346234 RepID=UPI00367DA110